MAEKSMTILDLEGTPRQCGQAHGEAMRDQIMEIREIFLEQSGLPGVHELEAMCWQMFMQTGFLEAARRWTPDLAEEVEGISDGAGIGRGFIWAFQHQDEMINLANDLSARPTPEGSACTSLGSGPLDGSPAVVAQNLDTPAIYHGHQTLLKIRYRGRQDQALVVSEPGLVGICGLNSSGVGVCQNTLAWQLNRSLRGVAAMLVARGLLHQPNLEKAVGFLKTIPHASGINYAVGGPEGVVDYECSPNQHVQFIPEDTPGRIYHTNHPLVNTDLYPADKLPQAGQEYYQRFIANTYTRFDALRRRLAQISGPLTVSTIQDILASHDSEDYPICRHIRPELGKMGSCTNNTVIMELTSSPRMLLSSEPPCQHAYQEFGFR